MAFKSCETEYLEVYNSSLFNLLPHLSSKGDYNEMVDLLKGNGGNL